MLFSCRLNKVEFTLSYEYLIDKQTTPISVIGKILENKKERKEQCPYALKQREMNLEFLTFRMKHMFSEIL